jgi:hypothetical protein
MKVANFIPKTFVKETCSNKVVDHINTIVVEKA